MKWLNTRLASMCAVKFIRGGSFLWVFMRFVVGLGVVGMGFVF